MNINQDNFIVRPMTLTDLKLALSWATNEGWNPGIDDANNFYVADPQGFLIGELNGEPISCISVVRSSQDFSFIGIYLVKPEWRKKGFGLKTWQEAMKLINNQPAGLDAVLEQVNTYAKSGFKTTHRHLRYQGIISGKISQDIKDLKTVNFDQLCSMVELDNSTGKSVNEITSFNYDKLLANFAKPIELRKVDYKQYSIFGLLFIETREENFLEIQKILDSDLSEFITVNK